MTTAHHRMHLKGPWQFRWIERDGAATSDESGRVRMPASWQECFGTDCGLVEFQRRFHCPTNLDPDERVHIAFDGLGGVAVVAVNHIEIGRVAHNSSTVSFDMTPHLQPANELTVSLKWSANETGTGGLHAPVAIEIHRVAVSPEVWE